MSKRIKVIAVVGPTATGKSSLGVHLAKKFGGEIISADSRQVYRGLDIGTEKITKREVRGIPHYLIDVASPRRAYSAARYKKDAEKIIRNIIRESALPIVVGGTGFYLDTLLGNAFLPKVPPNYKLRRQLEAKSVNELSALLARIDPRRAQNIDVKNRRRLTRAIEIAKTLDTAPPSECFDISKQYDVLWIGLDTDDNKLKEIIEKRFERALRKGLAAETRNLRTGGLSWKRVNELGLEYRIVGQFLRGEIAKDEMLRKANTELWRYAKRQRTWFRRNKNIHWFQPTETGKIERTVRNFLAT